MTKFSFLPLLMAVFSIELTAQTIQITCEKPVMIFNNHVGNEWGFQMDVNGTPQQINNPLNIPISDIQNTSFVVYESNETHPDFASTSLNIEASALIPNKEYSKEIDVVITESNGRYSGNQAKWRLKFYYKKVVSRT